MLSRTADHLFWMSRYMERAENTARMLNVSYETSLLPQSAAAAQAGWEGILSISELLPSYMALYKTINPRDVMEFMVKDADNPSSILSCLRAARENARAVRGTLTTEVWETQNQTWLEVNRMLKSGQFERDPGQFFEWVKFRSHLSRGVTVGTMLMDEALHFMRLGTFLERADNTARLVDVAQYINRTDNFDFDMISNIWGQSMSPGNEQRDFWGSDSANATGSTNLAGIANPAIDAIIESLIAAPTREALVAQTRALDRVLQWGHWVIPHWHSREDRVLYWDKFGHPQKVPVGGTDVMTWWIDKDKAATLEARKAKLPQQ